MPNREHRAYFEGLEIIRLYLPEERAWIVKLTEEFPRIQANHVNRRRLAFKLYVNLMFSPITPERERLALLAAYSAYRNRLFGSKDDQLTPRGIEELT